jgi:hypothetical protein
MPRIHRAKSTLQANLASVPWLVILQTLPEHEQLEHDVAVVLALFRVHRDVHAVAQHLVAAGGDVKAVFFDALGRAFIWSGVVHDQNTLPEEK